MSLKSPRNQLPGTVANSSVVPQFEVVVSTKGLASGTSLPNNGAPFGPDASPLNPVDDGSKGINAALAYAAANGINRVRITDGQIQYTTAIVIPSKWSGILEGAGNNQPGPNAQRGTVLAYTGAAAADGFHFTGNLAGFTVKHIYFTTAVNMTSSLVNMSNVDARRRILLERVTIDVGGTTTPTSLDMSGNQDSEGQWVECYGAPLKWYTPGGGVKLIGGVFDSGFNFQAQQVNMIAVTWEGTMYFNSGTVTGGDILAAGRNDIVNLFGCYTNNPHVGGNTYYTRAYYSTILNASGSVINLNVVGGRFYLASNAPNGTAYIDSDTPGDTILGGGGGLTLANCGWNIGLAETTLVGPGATNTMNALSLAAVTVTVNRWESPNYVGLVNENLNNSVVGTGTPYNIFSAGWVTGRNATTAVAKQVPTKSDGTYFVLLMLRQTAAGAGTLLVTVAYKDPSGTPQTRTMVFQRDPDTVLVSNPGNNNGSVWSSVAFPYRINGGATVTVTMTLTGAMTWAYSLDLVRVA